MFSIVTFASISATVLGAAIHYVVFGPRRSDTQVTGKHLRRWSGWQRCLHGITALSFLVLAVTGFWSALWFDEFEGWWLWAHLLAAPVFAVGLTVMAIAWAEACRFAAHDAEWLQHGGGYFARNGDLPADKFDAGQKVFFWSVVTLGFLVIASMMAVILPVSDQNTIAALYALHRYSALGLLVAVILHTYTTLFANPGTWRAMLSGYVSEDWARRWHPLWRSPQSTEHKS